MGRLESGIHAGRLKPADYDSNFADLHPAYDDHEALTAADRCYFCYDAPCMTACPTEIDVPLFIRQIATGNAMGAAKTIFDQNIMGGMCARVCPTETLCEQACVRNASERKPVEIGRLQRFATDKAMAEDKQFYQRAASNGKTVGIVGGGPAGLAAAHRLAIHGFSATIYECREKPGGLNEYGIAAYKATDDIAQKEVDYIIACGGIEILNGQMLGRDFSLDDLKAKHDAIFLGMGLGGVNALKAEGSHAEGILDAVEFIENLRKADNKADIPVGRKVVVIGGGMTAIDAAVQAKLLGAEEVTICYRRGQENMNASPFEQDLATSKGVMIRHWLAPKSTDSHNGHVTGIALAYTHAEDGQLKETGQIIKLECDQILTAIGQTLALPSSEKLDIEHGKIAISDEGKTSIHYIWAGGDCATGGDDLTVSAVAMGRDAAMSIIKTFA